MKVILKETISSLGIIGSEVTVAPGYARNYLFPQGKAVPATPEYRKRMEQEKAKFELQIAKEREFAQEMAGRLEMVAITIASKIHEADRIYGSVTARDIFDALQKESVEVERRMILLSEPIKTLGTFKVPIRIYQGINPEITVHVVPEEA
ncbi:50S ribosomal protein L9 [Desulfosarcina sp. OttesenSCG-928-A07]|nr:50S ribosomal protein L9 [Desulfosarcina sp. OttesenSCG-928-A07]